MIYNVFNGTLNLTESINTDSTDGATVLLLHGYLHTRFNLHLDKYLKNFINYTEYPQWTRCSVRASGASYYNTRSKS